MTFRIGHFDLAPGCCYVIAETGHGHSFDRVIAMVDKVQEMGGAKFKFAIMIRCAVSVVFEKMVKTSLPSGNETGKLDCFTYRCLFRWLSVREPSAKSGEFSSV